MGHLLRLSAPPICGPSGRRLSAPPAPVSPDGRGLSAPPICSPQLSAPPALVSPDGQGLSAPPISGPSGRGLSAPPICGPLSQGVFSSTCTYQPRWSGALSYANLRPSGRGLSAPPALVSTEVRGSQLHNLQPSALGSTCTLLTTEG